VPLMKMRLELNFLSLTLSKVHTGNFFSAGFFYIVHIHFYKVNIFLSFTGLIFKILFVQVEAF